MYTKEQIQKAFEAHSLDASLFDSVISILDSNKLKKSLDCAYLQPLSVKIVKSKFDVCGAWGGRQIYLDLQVVAVARYVIDGSVSEVFSYPSACEMLVSGGIDIKALNNPFNNRIDLPCLVPIAAHNKIIDGVNNLCLDVISSGNVSKYTNGNLYINELLIKASIMDGSLIIKG